jgi:uncharacterized membrane protein YfcA
LEFPISGVFIDPFLLASVGFIVGLLAGFFGVGGGFLAGPFMFWMGIPMNFVVGTDLAHIAGNSFVAFKRHRALGNVDIKLGLVMVVGTAVGVEIGAQIIERLKINESVDLVVGFIYIVLLIGVSAFTFFESIRAIRALKEAAKEDSDSREFVGFKKLSKRIQKINIWPMISFPASGIEQISLWVVLLAGLTTGVLTGMLGVGGGFIRMPVFIYVLGVPTHVALGTDLFEIIFSAGYGTITHALKGNVDIIMALVMQTGAALGAQLGATSTQFFKGPVIRLLFSFLPLLGAVLVIIRFITEGVVAF